MSDVEIEIDVEDVAVEEETVAASEEAKPKRQERKRAERLEDLVEVPKPDEAEYNAERHEAQTKLDEVLGQMNTITVQIDTLSAKRKTAVDSRRAIQDKQAELKSQKAEAYEKGAEAEKKLEEIEKIRTSKRQALDQHKAGLKFTNVEALDGAVQKIQLKLTTGNLPRDVQQKLLSDLNSLKSQRTKVLAYAAMRQLAEVETVDTEGINKQLEIESKITKTIAETNRALYKELQEHRKTENVANKEISELIKERKTLGKSKYELTQTLSNLDYHFTRKSRNYERYIESVKYFKRQQQRKERAARDAEYAEQNAEPEEKIAKIPYGKELQICDDLARYCRSLLGNKAGSPTAEAAAAEESKAVDINQRNAAFKGKAGNALAQEKDEREEWVAAARETFGQKKKRVRTKKQNNIINHIPDIFFQFKVVDIEPPLLKTAVEATLAAILKKTEYYKTAPPPADKKKASADAVADKKAEQTENKERTRNRRKSVQMADDEQERRVTEAAVQEEEASAERRSSIQNAMSAADAEKERRIKEEQAHADEEAAERKTRVRRASLMADEEQARRVAEYEAKKASGDLPKLPAAASGDLTSQLQAAETARTGKGGAPAGKAKKAPVEKKDQNVDQLTSQLQAAEKARTSKK